MKLSAEDLQEVLAELRRAKLNGLVKAPFLRSAKQHGGRSSYYRALIEAGRCGWCAKENDQEGSLCATCRKKDSESKKRRKKNNTKP